MIRFEGVSKSYGDDTPVLSDFNLDIENGEMVFLTGRSGSGKTTLIMLLLRELLAEKGRIIIEGKDIEKLGKNQIPYYRREIGVIFQDFRLIPDMTVYENLYTAILATGGRKSDAEKKITDVLTMLGIDRFHKRYPRELSGGEQQKVCLARALINNPKILLADEPTGNLDPNSSKEILKLLELVNKQGVTIIMATHDIANIEETLDENSYRRIRLDEKIIPIDSKVAS
ncbi:MAG: ATP-binding cassette domain-containing protein [Butyrivibrio sp.]|nr:ATP-binding cassette domain-containing protein [Butyrivibrio sp.]